MTDKKKKKGHKTMRKPPSDPDLDTWVSGADSKANAGAKSSTDDNSGSQVTGNSGTQVADSSKNKKPSGTGIVERADGSFRRRLVVYIDTDHAKELKVHAALNDRDMSEIVDELLGNWISSKST